MLIRLVIAAFIGGGVYLQWQIAVLEKIQARVAAEVAALQQKNTQQQEQNAEIKARLVQMSEHPDEVFEALAREKLFMVKSDEIYILPAQEAR